MIDPLYLVVFVASVIVAVAAGFMMGTLRERRRLADIPAPPPVLPPGLFEELADLRHLKAQLDTPPQHHEHIWPREPDVRKMGWLRYHCAFANCPAIEWRPKKGSK